MLNFQNELDVSSFSGLYDILVKEDHLLRKSTNLVDFSFIVNEVKDNYCLNDGGNAIDPVQLFKYMLLKVIYDLSDRDLVSRTFTDLSFNYFLGLSSEDNVIHPTTLTKFGRLRLKNDSFLDQLISKSIEIAIQKGVIASNTIIIDATHTKSAYNAKSPIELLRERSKNLRKKAYLIDETLKEKMPKKYTGSELTDELGYSGKGNLSYVKKKDIKLVAKLNPKVSKGRHKESDGFTFNKDADMMVCFAGELAVRKARQGKKNQNKIKR